MADANSASTSLLSIACAPFQRFRAGARSSSGSLGRVACAIAVGLAALGCASGSGVPPAASVEAPRPRNAAALAEELARGKTSMLVFPARARGHALSAKALELGQLAPLLRELGLDPVRDLERVFVSSPAIARAGREIVVLEHALPEARVRTMVDQLIRKSQPAGTWRKDLAVPAAVVTVRGETRVVAMATPTVLIVVPEELASAVARFSGTGGLPDPVADELAVARAADPAKTLVARGLPRLPKTLRSAAATLVLRPDGGAAIDLDAASTSAAQAALDAVELSATADRATSVKVAFMRVRFFQPIQFHAAGEHVKARIALTAREVDRLLDLAIALQ